MPYLALAACTVFVLFLLRLEHNQSFGVTRALWIPTLWFLYTTSKSLGTWLGISSDMEAGSPPDRIFLIILFSLGLIILFKRRFDWSNAAKENSWLVLIIAFMFVSLLWSGMPAISFRRWVRELVAVTMAFVVLSEPNPRSALQGIFRRAIYMLIPFSIVLIKYFPGYGRQYARWSGELMWVGVSNQKNSLARLCIVSVLFLVYVLVSRLKKKELSVSRYQAYVEIFLLLLSLYLLGGPNNTLKYSVTSSVSLMTGILTFAVFLWTNKHDKTIGPVTLKTLVLFLIVYGTVTPFLGKLTILDISSFFGRSETLTGRAEIWATLLPYAMQKPILGHGVGGFWTTSMREMTSSHAHNGYLDLILVLGFIGLFLFAIYLLACLKRAIRIMSVDFEWGILFVSFIFLTLLYNVAESGIGTLSNALSAVIMFFFVSSSEKAHAEKSPVSGQEQNL